MWLEGSRHAGEGVFSDHLRLPRLWSMTAVRNTAPKAVMRRLGMVPHAGYDHPDIGADHPIHAHVAYLLDRPAQP